MDKTLGALLPHTNPTVVEYCQSLPGMLLATGQYANARTVLLELAHLCDAGYLPDQVNLPRRKAPSTAATLWFVQAGYAYFGCTHDQETWTKELLPRMKRMSQAIIAGQFSGTRMGDGGLLELDAKADPVEQLVINILWDNALTVLAEELRRIGDHTGDHLERLAGRFKRSFLKAYWSDQYECLVAIPPGPVPPAATENTPPAPAAAPESAPADPFKPEPQQLLAAVLPASSVPRTKQRQVVDLFRRTSVAPMGVYTHVHTAKAGKSRKSTDRQAACPLYLAWLAEAHVRTSDMPATALAEAIEMLRPVHDVLVRDGTLAHYYDEHGPITIKGENAAHGPTIAEVHRLWRGLQEASDRPLGNSKRTRITGTLMPRCDT